MVWRSLALAHTKESTSPRPTTMPTRFPRSDARTGKRSSAIYMRPFDCDQTGACLMPSWLFVVAMKARTISNKEVWSPSRPPRFAFITINRRGGGFFLRHVPHKTATMPIIRTRTAAMHGLEKYDYDDITDRLSIVLLSNGSNITWATKDNTFHQSRANPTVSRVTKIHVHICRNIVGNTK